MHGSNDLYDTIRALTRIVACLCAIGAISSGAQAATSTYHYDFSGRLMRIDGPGQSIIYTYDAAGNRTAVAVQATGVDIGVALDASPDGNRIVGNHLVYTVDVRNVGTVPASALILLFDPDDATELTALAAGRWTCHGTGPVTCTLASLAAGASRAVQFDVLPRFEGPIVASASVSTQADDVQPANDTARKTTLIVGSGIAGDTDGDGMPDAWEIANGLDARDASDAGLDADGDHLSNRDEYARGTDPNRPDSDGDGANDDVDGAPLFNPAWLSPILAPLGEW